MRTIQLFILSLLISNILYSNNSKEINFYNSKAKIKLSGTLIEPAKSWNKMVIILAGTGKNLRNTFNKLADSLLNSNVAVYRYDDRGVGKSQGSYSKATTFDFASDLASCINYFESDSLYMTKEIGVISHSEGTLMTIIALKEIKKDLSFMVLMGAPVLKGDQVIIDQTKGKYHKGVYQFKDEGPEQTAAISREVIDIMLSEKDPKKAETLIHDKLKSYGIKNLRVDWNTTFFRCFLSFDPIEYYRSITIRTFYIAGSEDAVMKSSTNIERLKTLNNPNIKIEEMDGGDHNLRSKGAYFLDVGKITFDEVYNMDNGAIRSIVNFVLE